MLGASQLLNGPTNGQTLDEPPVERSYSLGESWSGGGASTASARDSLASKLAEQRGPGSRATRRGGFAGAVGGFVRTARARARSGPGAGAPSTPAARRLTFDEPASFSAAAAEYTPASRVEAPRPPAPEHELGAFFLAPGQETRSLVVVDCVCDTNRVVEAAGRFGAVSGVDDSRGAPRSKTPSRETAGRVATPPGTRPSASSSSSSTTCAPAARPRPV